MERQCRLIAVITTLFAMPSFQLYQVLPSLSATSLLSRIVLVFVVGEVVFALVRTEFCLPAGQLQTTNQAQLFHRVFNDGLPVRHHAASDSRSACMQGAPVESVKFGEAFRAKAAR